MKPPLGAAAFSVTVQLSIPAPLIDPLVQLSPLNTDTPVPPWPEAGAFSCKANVSETPPALAVSVTVCAELTEETVAVKLAEVDPAPTVTEAGTVTAGLLLAKLTAEPPLAAAALSVTVQLSVPAPFTAPFTQPNELNSDELVLLAAVPVPLSPTRSVPSATALLEIVN